MNISAVQNNEAKPRPVGLADWLASQGLSDPAFSGQLVSLLEPLGAFVAVKTVATGRYAFASAGLGHLFERGDAGLFGSTDSDFLRPDEVVAMRRVEQSVMAQRSVVVSEHRLEIGGRRREFSVTRVALGAEHLVSIWLERTEERHREVHLQRALTQIEQQQKAIEQIRREMQAGSGRDDVSGLYLRAQFDDQLLREIDLSTREHREFALVIIALDPSANAAAAIGDAANERMLEGVGRMLRDNTRAMDAACRIGEHRFAVLLSGVGLATAHARM